MIAALQQFPRFDKGSPSSEYQQIINFCVNYLEGMLVGLIHMEIPSDIELLEDPRTAMYDKLNHQNILRD